MVVFLKFQQENDEKLVNCLPEDNSMYEIDFLGKLVHQVTLQVQTILFSLSSLYFFSLLYLYPRIGAIKVVAWKISVDRKFVQNGQKTCFEFKGAFISA